MNVQKKDGAEEAPFDPLTGEILDGVKWREGKRRKASPVPSVDLRWPETRPARQEAFEAWHQIAMQVVHTGKVSFRTMAVLWRFVHWKTGEIFPSNITLCAVAGRPSERTITRELASYEDLGIIRSRLQRKQKRNGGWKTIRIIILTVPANLASEMTMLNSTESAADDDENDDFSLDNSGLPRNDVWIDTRGLGQVDNRGLVTLEGTLEKGGGNAT